MRRTSSSGSGAQQCPSSITASIPNDSPGRRRNTCWANAVIPVVRLLFAMVRAFGSLPSAARTAMAGREVLAALRNLGVPDDDERVNPNGGAIALGHPLGMSGPRLVLTAAYELRRRQGRFALCTMCIGVGQGIAMVIERV